MHIGYIGLFLGEVIQSIIIIMVAKHGYTMDSLYTPLTASWALQSAGVVCIALEVTDVTKKYNRLLTIK
jgi:hypothetical protein